MGADQFGGFFWRPGGRDRGVADKFRDQLIRAGILTITRKTRGDDIDAACGQLVGKALSKSAKRRAKSSEREVTR